MDVLEPPVAPETVDRHTDVLEHPIIHVGELTVGRRTPDETWNRLDDQRQFALARVKRAIGLLDDVDVRPTPADHSARLIMQRFGRKLEPAILAVDTAEPRLRFAANAGLHYIAPVIGQPIDVFRMNCDGPSPPDGLRLCEPGVLEPPPIEILRRALSVRQPHQRRNRIDDRSELAIRDVRVVRSDSPHGAARSCHRLGGIRTPLPDVARAAVSRCERVAEIVQCGP